MHGPYNIKFDSHVVTCGWSDVMQLTAALSQPFTSQRHTTQYATHGMLSSQQLHSPNLSHHKDTQHNTLHNACCPTNTKLQPINASQCACLLYFNVSQQCEIKLIFLCLNWMSRGPNGSVMWRYTIPRKIFTWRWKSTNLSTPTPLLPTSGGPYYGEKPMLRLR
jgi:hypothetical protein